MSLMETGLTLGSTVDDELFLRTIPEDRSTTGVGPVYSNARNNDTGSNLGASEINSTRGVVAHNNQVSPEGDRVERPAAPQDPSDNIFRCQAPQISRKIYVIGAVFAIVVAVGLYFIFRGRTSASEEFPTLSPAPSVAVFTDDFLPTDHPTVSPTNFPTIPPTVSMQPSVPLDGSSQATLDFIESLMGTIVNDAEEPEGKASTFIIYTDEAKVRVDEDGEYRVTQRYILSYFFFRLNGQVWWTDNFVTKEHECDWEGILCTDAMVVRRISLPRTNLLGELPSEMTYLSALESIWLSENDLQGTIPHTWFEFPRLTWLDLSSNDFTGTFPPELWDAPSLQVFEVHDNWLDGTIPEIPANSNSTLGQLDVSRNLLNGKLPASLWNITSLTLLYLDENDITGTIPPVPDDGLKRNLKVIWLYENKLVGPLPESLTALQNLEKILVQKNQFTSTIPGSWIQLDHLQFLGVSYNRLTGTVPDFSDSQTMTSLRIRNNSLTGEIPQKLPQFIVEALMENNEFVGMIPPNYGVGLQNLTRLQLYGNMLTGTLSPSLCGKVALVADCTDPASPFYVECECCEGCT